MAKRYDNDFDAEGFVENFRASEDAPAPRSNGDQTETEKVDDVPQIDSLNPGKNPKVKPAEMARDYKAQFIDDLKYRFPSEGWAIVRIHPNFKARISYLENLCGGFRANLSTFINNVLEQHFRDYEAHIKNFKKEYRKNEE